VNKSYSNGTKNTANGQLLETFARDRYERKMRENLPDCGGKRRE